MNKCTNCKFCKKIDNNMMCFRYPKAINFLTQESAQEYCCGEFTSKIGISCCECEYWRAGNRRYHCDLKHLKFDESWQSKQCFDYEENSDK